jgi:tetratricopeptide (TPR) repeat protein
MPDPLSNSPDFLAVRRGLLRMHQLAAKGLFESAEAEALRDAMDAPWEGLTAGERDRLTGLSADLNAISEILAERPAAEANPQAQGKLVEAYEARERGEWDRSLALLRRWDKYVPSALASYLRGSIWRAAGDAGVAAVFFDHASRLDPGNGNYEAVLLHVLKAVDLEKATERAEDVLAHSEDRTPAAVVHALEVVFATTHRAAESAANATFRRLIPLLERTLERMTEQEDIGGAALVGMTLSLLASCHERLRDTRRAYEYYSRAIQRDPRNDALLTARGQLGYGTGPQSATDFEQAVRLGSSLVWPYLYLAHYYLANNRFEEARTTCELGLQRKSSDRVRSELQEFLAISQAGLGYPEDVVRRAFESAIRTDPSNDRARRNLDMFESALATRAPRPKQWERRSESSLRTSSMEEVWDEIPSSLIRDPALV